MEQVRNRRKPSVESKASQGSSWSSVSGSQQAINGRRYSFAQQKALDTKKGPCERVVHQSQDSLFSSSSGWTNYRGFFNLSILLLVVSNGRVALENLIKYGILITPVHWISLFMEDLSLWNWPNLALIVGSNATILLVFFVEKALEKGYRSNTFAAVFYPFLVIFHLVVPVFFSLMSKNQNPLFVVATMSTYVIEALKIVSYVHVNYWARCARVEVDALKKKFGAKRVVSEHASGSKEHNTKKSPLKAAIDQPVVEEPHKDLKDELSLFEMSSLYPSTLTLSNLYFFMVAPTLCYELKFPRTHRRRKQFLIKRIIEVVFLAFLMAALVQQWVVPTVRNSMAPLSEMELSRVLERLLKLAVPNHVIWLIFFYTTFHSLLNLIAEVLRFADREFYRDFWNAETIAYFWKTWNIPVHRWALRHIYCPMMRNNYSKTSAMIAVFFVSAFFHEYLVSVPLQLFRLWAYYGMMAQIPLSFITDKVVKGGRAGNIIVWLSLIVGQPLAILMYVHDWYVIHHPSLVNNGTYDRPTL